MRVKLVVGSIHLTSVDWLELTNQSQQTKAWLVYAGSPVNLQEDFRIQDKDVSAHDQPESERCGFGWMK
jgi:hypothetical protein